jgi:hypothetical protein
VRVTDPRRAVRSAVILLLARVLLVAAATVLAWLIFSAAAGDRPFPPSPMVAALSLLPVNIACLFLTVTLLRAEGQTFHDLFAYQHRTWLSEIGWGLIWIVVLYVPFAAASSRPAIGGGRSDNETAGRRHEAGWVMVLRRPAPRPGDGSQ